jgi:hypothetical protein
MDNHGFDSLVRALAVTRNRRLLLQGVVASGVATFAVRLSPWSVRAQVVSTDSDQTCAQDSDCIRAEVDPCTGAICDAGACSFTSVACMRGHACCGNGECCPEGEADASPDATAAGESAEAQPEASETSEPHCTNPPSSDE